MPSLTIRALLSSILVFGNVSQQPFVNNLLPPVRALRKVGDVTLVEPFRIEGFVGTGGASPALIPHHAVVDALKECRPDLVVCLAGALYLSDESRALFPANTVFAGFALSDPLGLDASLAIAPSFDLFYTQDPRTIDAYRAKGIAVRRSDPAVDPELFYPMPDVAKQCDMIFYGKWTAFREEILRELAREFAVRIHAYPAEKRWTLPVSPPLNTPDELRIGLNATRLALEFAVLDDAVGPFRGTSRLTNRPQHAAACEIPTLIDDFDFLPQFFEPDVEIAPFRSPAELIAKARALLSDDAARTQMGRAARARVVRSHTWDQRIAMLMRDVQTLRNS